MGEYPLMAMRLIGASEAAIEVAAVESTDKVLDVATGTGNAALLAAESGAEVIGVDLEPALLQVAESRAAALRRTVQWVLADAVDTPIDSGWADVVVSVFGVMFVADQAAAARELARCAAPGARVVVAAWRPGSFMSSLGSATKEFFPAVPSGPPPSRWGDPDGVRELLGGAGLVLESADTRTITLTFEDADDAADFVVRTAGHLASGRARLEVANQWGDLCDRVRTLVVKSGLKVNGQFAIDAPYLLTLARKP
jgi:SAM-dependent methyltransferase